MDENQILEQEKRENRRLRRKKSQRKAYLTMTLLLVVLVAATVLGVGLFRNMQQEELLHSQEKIDEMLGSEEALPTMEPMMGTPTPSPEETFDAQIEERIAAMTLEEKAVDFFADKNEYRTAFMFLALVVFVLMTLHTTSMILAVEPESPVISHKKISEMLKSVLGNKNVLHVMVVFVLYNVAVYLSTPFYATYLIGELSLNLKTVSGLAIVSSIVRMCATMRWGRYADKTSFSNMTGKCLLVLVAGYLCVFFATPKIGLYAFALYYVFHGIAMGGYPVPRSI